MVESEKELALPSLRELALEYGTDKAGGRDQYGAHEFCEAYEFFLGRWRNRRFSMIEVGVGGDAEPDRGGNSLRMWRRYFTEAEIVGVDLHKKDFEIDGVKIVQCDQTDIGGLREIVDGLKRKPALIIDDASHQSPLTLRTWSVLWPELTPGGYYVIEDIHTSYWHGGGWKEGLHMRGTTMSVMKTLTDWLNREHMREAELDTLDLVRENFPTDIESIHFFKEIVFIKKKDADIL